MLESTIPFYTGPAWASFATGSSPAAHGVYDFMMLRDDGTLSVARHDDLRRKTYYQQLGEEGKRSVLVNLPIDQDGCDGAVIVNSWLTERGLAACFRWESGPLLALAVRRYRTFPSDPATSTSCARSSRHASTSRGSSSSERLGPLLRPLLVHGLDRAPGTGSFLSGDPTLARADAPPLPAARRVRRLVRGACAGRDARHRLRSRPVRGGSRLPGERGLARPRPRHARQSAAEDGPFFVSQREQPRATIGAVSGRSPSHEPRCTAARRVKAALGAASESRSRGRPTPSTEVPHAPSPRRMHRSPSMPGTRRGRADSRCVAREPSRRKAGYRALDARGAIRAPGPPGPRCSSLPPMACGRRR